MPTLNETDEQNNPYHSIQVVKLDDLDKFILKRLQTNGKLSMNKLAHESGHSVSTVKVHYDRLQSEGVIERVIAVVNCNKIGYREMLHFYISIYPNVPFEDVVSKLIQVPSINAIYHVSGDHPIFCIAKCVEKPDQIKLLNEVKSIPGIEKIQTQVVLERIKEDMRVSIPK